MSIPERDKAILQDLAKKRVEIASLPIQEEKKELWRRLNRLDPVRPMVLLSNGTWHQTGDEIQLETEIIGPLVQDTAMCPTCCPSEANWPCRTCSARPSILSTLP